MFVWRRWPAGTDRVQDGPVSRLLLTLIVLHHSRKVTMKDTGESKDHQLTVSSSFSLKQTRCVMVLVECVLYSNINNSNEILSAEKKRCTAVIQLTAVAANPVLKAGSSKLKVVLSRTVLSRILTCLQCSTTT